MRLEKEMKKLKTSNDIGVNVHELLDAELKKDILSLLYQITNSRVGYFGTWKGYLAQLNITTVDKLVKRLSI